MNWSTVAFLFPGQGSQLVGMGKDIADAYPVARELFDRADAIVGFKLSKLCFEGAAEVLNDTINTQPAIYVCSLAILAALRVELPTALPAVVAGHSFGELTALAAIDALSFEDGLRLALERGRLMKMVGELYPGAMAAVFNLDATTVSNLCTQAEMETNGVLVLANDNSPGQIVISGDEATLERGLALMKQAGAKRAVKLAVSIAAHSPIMAPAAEAFGLAVRSAKLRPMRATLYANVTARPIYTTAEIQEELDAQLMSSVRWRESVEAMIRDGVETFIEIGPKDVLTGLVSRIDANPSVINLNSLEALQNFVAQQSVIATGTEI